MKKALVILAIFVAGFFVVSLSWPFLAWRVDEAARSMGPCAGWNEYITVLNAVNAEQDQMTKATSERLFDAEEYRSAARRFRELGSQVNALSPPDALAESHALTRTMLDHMALGMEALAVGDVEAATKELTIASNAWKERQPLTDSANDQCGPR